MKKSLDEDLVNIQIEIGTPSPQINHSTSTHHTHDNIVSENNPNFEIVIVFLALKKKFIQIFIDIWDGPSKNSTEQMLVEECNTNRKYERRN